MKLAEPLLDRYNAHDSYEATSKIIGIAIIAWNISLHPIEDREIEKNNTIKPFSKMIICLAQKAFILERGTYQWPPRNL